MSSHPGVMSQVLQNLKHVHSDLDLDPDPDLNRAPDHAPDLDHVRDRDLDRDTDHEHDLDHDSDRILHHDLDPDLDLDPACHPEISGATATALARSAATPPLSSPHTASAMGG